MTSQAGQEAVYLGVLLKGFGYKQKGPDEIWEDNTSCIMMSENPTNRNRFRHVDVKVHVLRDLVRDGHVKLLKSADTRNVSDTLTKSLPRPASDEHREFMVGTRVPFSVFYANVNPSIPMSTTMLSGIPDSKYVTLKFHGLLWITLLRYLFLCILRSVLSIIVRTDNYSSTRGSAK